MKKLLKFAFLAIAFCALAAISTFAQSSSDAKNEFSIWGGYSPDSLTKIHGTGRVPDAKLGVFALRYARRFNDNDTLNLRYTLDVLPVVVLNFPDFIAVGNPPIYRMSHSLRATRYAFGVSPLGLRANFRPRKKLQPYVDGTGGLLFFNKDVPSLVGVKLGFTAHIGGGVEYNLKNGKAVDFGYKYFHISNANRGNQNPGFDNNLFYVGYTFRRT